MQIKICKDNLPPVAAPTPRPLWQWSGQDTQHQDEQQDAPYPDCADQNLPDVHVQSSNRYGPQKLCAPK